MVLLTIGVIIAIILGFVNLFLVFNLYKNISHALGTVNNKISSVEINSKISNMFSGGSGVEGVGDSIIQTIKETFHLKGTSYSQLIKEVTDSTIRQDIKDTLLEFFNEMIEVSYKHEILSDAESAAFQRKIKGLLKKLQSF